jgi:hypothetical protein
MNDLLELDMHPFSVDVLRRGEAASRPLGDRSRASVVPDYTRDPDEHEFFLLRVAACLVEVLNCCHQLNQIPLYLANHRQTPAMKKATINRHSVIVYHIENYIIRTQSLLDRVLKLVDAVFHLLNNPRNCRFDVVIKNVKVEISDVPESIKSLRKLLGRYSAVRSEVIHEHSIKEDNLRILDLYFLLERWQEIFPRSKRSNARELAQDMTREVLWKKKQEFSEFNKELAIAIAHIFEKLAPYFSREEQALKKRLSKPVT